MGFVDDLHSAAANICNGVLTYTDNEGNTVQLPKDEKAIHKYMESNISNSFLEYPGFTPVHNLLLCSDSKCNRNVDLECSGNLLEVKYARSQQKWPDAEEKHLCTQVFDDNAANEYIYNKIAGKYCSIQSHNDIVKDRNNKFPFITYIDSLNNEHHYFTNLYSGQMAFDLIKLLTFVPVSIKITDEQKRYTTKSEHKYFIAFFDKAIIQFNQNFKNNIKGLLLKLIDHPRVIEYTYYKYYDPENRSYSKDSSEDIRTIGILNNDKIKPDIYYFDKNKQQDSISNGFSFFVDGNKMFCILLKISCP